ncbi:MAG TPA: L-rhamnose mutarotase [Fimbriimonadaceae bacterium]|nr:L-rhamnose mutarotase [Fimbriimonadaceae bacterium]
MRVCFHLKVRPDRWDEYRRHHEAVWPEVLAALKAAGIRNYSIFAWRDGHEFGFLECDDWEAVQRDLAASKAVAQWEAFMADYLETPVEPGRSPERLIEIFRLD